MPRSGKNWLTHICFELYGQALLIRIVHGALRVPA
jgi:hypothetical protein